MQSVSRYQYRDHDCDYIALELERVSQRVGEIYAELKNDADNDAWQMRVGLILFWPALLALEGGDILHAQEYARLKGEYEALQKVAIRKQCDIVAFAGFAVSEGGSRKSGRRETRWGNNSRHRHPNEAGRPVLDAKLF